MQVGRIFHRMSERINGDDRDRIDRKAFIERVRSITKNVSEGKINEIFTHFTKKPETEARSGFLKNENRPNTAS